MGNAGIASKTQGRSVKLIVLTLGIEASLLFPAMALTFFLTAKRSFGLLGHMALFIVIESFFTLFFLALLRRFFPITPGTYNPDTDPWPVYRWRLHASLAEINLFFLYPLPLFPPIGRKFIYRLLGARMGKGLVVLNGPLHDPYLIEIGDDAIVGQDTCLIPHRWENGCLFLGTIRVGNGSVIGARSVVEPNVEIGRHVLVKAMSRILSGTRMSDNDIWAGAPAKQTARRDPSAASSGSNFMGWRDLILKPTAEALILGTALCITATLLPRSVWFTFWGVGTFFLVLTLVSLAAMEFLRRAVRFQEGVIPLNSGSWRLFFWSVYPYIILMNVFPLFLMRILPPDWRWRLARPMGAALGRGGRGGGLPFDPYLLKIGDDVILGEESIFLPHALTETELILKAIRMGDRAEIGERAMLMPGTEVGPGARLEPLSLLTMDRRMGPGEIWAGIPARKVGDRGPVENSPAPRLKMGGPLSLLIELVLLGFSAVIVYWFSPVAWDIRLVGFVIVHQLTALACSALLRLGFPPLPTSQKVELTRKQELFWRLNHKLLRGPLYWLSQGDFVPSFFRPWILRLLGARIGRGVTIRGYVDDPSAVTLGDHVWVGPDCLIVPHREENGQIILASLEIGERSSVGPHAVILGGGRLDPASRIDPMTLVRGGDFGKH